MTIFSKNTYKIFVFLTIFCAINLDCSNLDSQRNKTDALNYDRKNNIDTISKNLIKSNNVVTHPIHNNSLLDDNNIEVKNITNKIIGKWSCSDNLDGEKCDILWEIKKGNLYNLFIVCSSGERLITGKWMYQNNSMTIYANNTVSKATIHWIDNDRFILTETGIKRNYTRTTESIPTSSNYGQVDLTDCWTCGGTGWKRCVTCDGTGIEYRHYNDHVNDYVYENGEYVYKYVYKTVYGPQPCEKHCNSGKVKCYHY
jgi:hypothetical protein